MSDNTILAELERLATEHETQAKRYRDAAAVLRGLPTDVLSDTSTPAPVTQTVMPSVAPQRKGSKKGPYSTMSMIRTVLGTSMVGVPVPDLTERMLAGGWETQSEVPSNTVRTALARLVEKHEVVRNDDGTFSIGSRAVVQRILGVEPDNDLTGD